MANIFHAISARISLLVTDESGMSTVEYAIGTVGICRSQGLCAACR
nr:DUF4244 domain-containing protein [Mycobacterium kansasii]